MSRSIFISYRRSDSEGEAGRLSDLLSHRFSDQAIFMDVDAIQPGRDFRKAIEESIQHCAVLLTVIGPEWLEAKSARGERRLDEPNDYVRLEIGAALRRDIPVIPVLIRGAKMPHADELPADVSDLAYRNGVELTHARWKSDLQVLIRALEPYFPQAAEARPADVGPTPPRTAASQTQPVPQASVPQASATQTAAPPALTPPAPVRQPAPAPRVSSPQSPLEGPSVEKVSKLLAHYIGPIADLVVKRAARNCTSLPALCAAVAEEIESPSERLSFLAQSRH